MRTLILALVLFGCGKDDGSSSNKEDKSKRAMLVATTADLPECTAEDEGWLIYIKDSGMTACLAGKWEGVVELEKPDTIIAKQFYCGQSKDLFDGEDFDAQGNYLAVSYLISGDVLVSCNAHTYGRVGVDSREDYATDSMLFQAGSDAVGADLFPCLAGDLKMEFNGKVKSAYYSGISDGEEIGAGVTCTQTFPK